MDRIAGPVIAIAVILALGTGFYAFTLHQQIAKTEMARDAAEKRAVAATQQSQSVQVKVAEGTTALTTCQAQLTEATTRAAAAEEAAQSAQKSSAGGRNR